MGETNAGGFTSLGSFTNWVGLVEDLVVVVVVAEHITSLRRHNW